MKNVKNKLFLATAIIALAACSDNTYMGEPNGGTGTGGAISFNMSTPAITRAEPKTGSAAAADLGNQFIVWGEKNEINAGETGANVTIVPGATGREGHLVFENYKVEWTNNSAYTTTSNTQNWEYVGLTPYTSNVSPVISQATQTIKYWDYNAPSYTFTAVSALSSDITLGKVVITKTTSGENVYAKGYDIAIKTDASVDKIFVADRNNITKTTGTDRNASNTYGGNVTMQFRNFMSKIRFGIYENIPGYKVKITNVDYDGTKSETTNKFGVEGKFLVPGNNTAYTITYYTDNKVKAVVKGASPDSDDHLETAQTIDGCPILNTTSTNISTTPASPTWDKTDGAYTTILPFPNNDGNMKVQLDFTLISEDTGETISVVDATAVIPAKFCQWLPNYAYTYILKLNDNTNGQIGGVTGLYPITFDAIEITDETGKAEYITTVSEPSITTLGVKGSAYSEGQNEYADGTDVYTTVVDGGSVATLTKNSNIWLYTVTGTGITEAAVAERLIEAPTMNAAQITIANTKTNPTDVTTGSLTIQNTVPMEDNVVNNKTIGTNMVGKFTTATGTKYAIVYQKEAPTYYVSTGAKYADASAFATAKAAAVGGKLYSDETCETEAATWGDASTTYYQINGKTYTSEQFTAAGTLYTDAACTSVAESWSDGVTYYKPTKVKTKGTVVVKVVNCP